MEEIEIWRGVRGEGFADVGRVGFIGEFLGVVDIARGDDWVERCVLYRTDDGRVAVHQMRLSVSGDGVDVAEAYMLPALGECSAEGES